MPPKAATRFFECTACSKKIKDSEQANLHPLIGCLICRKCYLTYGTGDFAATFDEGVDDQGDDNYCRWCCDGGDLFGCVTGEGTEDRCHYSFCKDCIKRNVPDDIILTVDNMPEEEKASVKWACYACDKTKLTELRQKAKDAIRLLSESDGKKKQGEAIESNNSVKKRKIEKVSVQEKDESSSKPNKDSNVSKIKVNLSKTPSSQNKALPTKEKPRDSIQKPRDLNLKSKDTNVKANEESSTPKTKDLLTVPKPSPTQPKPASAGSAQSKPPSVNLAQPKPTSTNSAPPKPQTTSSIQSKPPATNSTQPKLPSTTSTQPKPSSTNSIQPKPSLASPIVIRKLDNNQASTPAQTDLSRKISQFRQCIDFSIKETQKKYDAIFSMITTKDLGQKPMVRMCLEREIEDMKKPMMEFERIMKDVKRFSQTLY